jgi:NADH-quinone oxidoreductase subunit I
MRITTAFRDVWMGFRSLLTGLRITFGQATKPSLTVQYPHETLKMPDRFRGHIKLVLDPVTGRSRCTACNLCVRACPSDCISVEGMKREGEKKKSVSEYVLDFTTCSLCGSCIESCPSDAIEFSKQYNVVSLHREDFSHMDLVRQLDGEREAWAREHPGQPAAPVAAPAPTAPAPVAGTTPAPAATAPAAPAPTSASPAPAPSVPVPPAVGPAVASTPPAS